MRLLRHSGRQSTFEIHVSELLALPIQFPGFQREVSEDHIQRMITHQRETFARSGYYLFLGCLEFARYQGTLYCIDGQHRYVTLHALIQENPMMDFDVVVEIIDALSLEEAQELFRLVNLSRPLPSFLLPDPMDATMDAVDATNVVDEEKAVPRTPHQRTADLREHLRARYAPYLTAADKPRRPHIHLDIFVEQVVKRYPHVIQGDEDPVEWLEQENAAHAAYLEANVAQEPIAKALALIGDKKMKDGTAVLHRFYLGCYWMDTLKNKLSAPIRYKAWLDWYIKQPAEQKHASSEIPCPCCETTLIHANSFHAGHRVSFKNGGTHSVDNLIPLCAMCNLSMGVMDYEVYKASLQAHAAL